MRRMVMRRLLAVLGALLMLTAGGCGPGSGNDAGPEGPGSTATSPPSRVQPESVTMQQSGGIAGVERTWRVTNDTRGADRVFAAAQDDALQAAAARTSTPICCDFFVYNILIRYSDGETLQIVTSDGADRHPAVDALLDAVLATGPAAQSSAAPR